MHSEQRLTVSEVNPENQKIKIADLNQKELNHLHSEPRLTVSEINEESKKSKITEGDNSEFNEKELKFLKEYEAGQISPPPKTNKKIN